MKGELHQQLRALLKAATDTGAVTQESLGRAMGEKSQTSVGQYLRDERRAGALDLDEAAAALHHIGSSLEDFIRGIPPRQMTPTERTAQRLELDPELEKHVRALLRVKRARLPGVLSLIRVGLQASGTPLEQNDVAPPEPPRVGRRTRGSKLRR